MSKRSRIALSISAFAVLAVSAPAHASPSLGDSGTVRTPGGSERCPAGYLCLFDGADGVGTMAYFRTGSPNLAMQNLDKAASSEWNRSAADFILYEGYNYTGRHNGTQPPGFRVNFSYYGGNNFFSSVRRA